jgi:hypothetical protein
MTSGSRVRRLVITVALLIAAGAGALWAPTAHAAVSQLLTVFVTNTPEQAIPTALIGTPSVAIAGTPTVGIAGTPSINIVRDGREPIQGSKVITTPDELGCATLYTVADGKRLVVEYVGVEALLAATNKVAVKVGAFSANSQINIPITAAFGALHVGSEVVRLVSVTDLHACASVEQAQGNVVASINVSWSGYLEDVQ